MAQPSLNVICRNGTTVRLEPKVMEVLVCLADHANETLSKEKLLQSVWPDTFVSDDGLKHSISELRRVFEDDAREPRVIQTVAKRGYRLVAPVEPVNGSKEPKPAASLTRSSNETDSRPAISKPMWRSGAIAIGIVISILVMLIAFQGSRSSRASSSPVIHSLAVLPLQNLSGDPTQEYFSDGMTDALITDLAQIGSVKVISRTSSMRYKQTQKSLPEIARELNVDGVVEGTVQRYGDRVRITAQLIEGRSDKHLWADSYERDIGDVLVLERDVTRDIADEILGKITSSAESALPQLRPINPKALEAYLQGTYHLKGYGRGSGEEELKRASEYFQKAIDIDPKFVPAYIGMAKAYTDVGVNSPEDTAMQKKAAETALALDPQSSEALEILAKLKWRDFDWSGAEQAYRQSIRFNTNNAEARDDFCTLLATMGHMEEASLQCQIAQELDPDNAHLPFLFYWRGEFDRAIAMLRPMIDRHPDDGWMHYLLFQSYAEQGDHKGAIEEAQKTLTLFGYSEMATEVHRAFITSGYVQALRTLARGLEGLQEAKQVFMPVNLADLYATLGEPDRAFYWLEQAYAHRDMNTGEPLDYIMVNPMINPLRSDPRYKELVRRVGLPQ